MKIIVLGTSNSVIGEKGYIAALRRDHVVINMSSGRVPYYSHIFKILKFKAIIESCDLLIIDHYVNDINLYNDALGEDYKGNIDYFYKLLSCLNVPVINLLFPLKHGVDENYLEYIKHMSIENNISVIDLNRHAYEDWYFNDPIHLSHRVSYILGMELSSEFKRLGSVEKSRGGGLEDFPFFYMDTFPCCESIKYSNSLIDIEYKVVNKEMRISQPGSIKLISIGYFNPNGHTAIKINKKNYSLDGDGYFHEAISKVIMGDVSFDIASCISECPNLINKIKGKNISSNPPNITELLFFDTDNRISLRRSERPILNVEIKRFIDDCRCLVPKKNKLASDTVDWLRDTAIDFEATNVKRSFDLMTLAAEHRSGPLILRKISKYRVMLGI
ncbi:hypothetical protein [Vibrio sp. 10N.261.52.F3]|uniref:hypothetical protein n=1 Tax=Vibrio sp. 10N.261.52.F3 TaxID=3229683 RepID=UPI0035535CC4